MNSTVEVDIRLVMRNLIAVEAENCIRDDSLVVNYGRKIDYNSRSLKLRYGTVQYSLFSWFALPCLLPQVSIAPIRLFFRPTTYLVLRRRLESRNRNRNQKSAFRPFILPFEHLGNSRSFLPQTHLLYFNTTSTLVLRVSSCAGFI